MLTQTGRPEATPNPYLCGGPTAYLPVCATLQWQRFRSIVISSVQFREKRNLPVTLDQIPRFEPTSILSRVPRTVGAQVILIFKDHIPAGSVLVSSLVPWIFHGCQCRVLVK